MHPDAVDVFPR